VTLAETLVTPAETFVHSGEATVKSTKSATVEATKSAAVETSAMEATKSAAVETPAAVDPPTPASAMWPSVGKIWLAERAGAQESSCGCQNLCRSWPGPMFA
jgi:hypothetical protein